jgi:hypothetical protein
VSITDSPVLGPQILECFGGSHLSAPTTRRQTVKRIGLIIGTGTILRATG